MPDRPLNCRVCGSTPCLCEAWKYFGPITTSGSSAGDGSLDPLVRALRDEGYAVADGIADMRNLMHAVSDDSTQPLCSGYRVFPDGTKCEGCADCSPNVPDQLSGDSNQKPK